VYIAQSKFQNAGHALFAARQFEPYNVIGWYQGDIEWMDAEENEGFQKPTNEYLKGIGKDITMYSVLFRNIDSRFLLVNPKPLMVAKPGAERRPLYMGMHYIKNPTMVYKQPGDNDPKVQH
jgi:hypothetical protein